MPNALKNYKGASAAIRKEALAIDTEKKLPEITTLDKNGTDTPNEADNIGSFVSESAPNEQSERQQMNSIDCREF